MKLFYQKKIDRAFDWIKEKNPTHDKNDNNDHDNKIIYNWQDYFAAIFTAFLVFSPIFIILILLMYFAFPG